MLLFISLTRLRLLLALLFFSATCLGQSQLVKNLQNGKDQLVIVYGTSLSSGGHGASWMDPVSTYLNEKYGDHLRYQLSGKGGMWSTWGVQNFEDSVVAKNPDAVIIEFGINDAFEKYETTPAVARLNLAYMIDRIRLQNPSCEVILQVMNMPVGKSAGFRPNLEAYYDMYREVAEEKNCLLIDHYPNWQEILNRGEDVFLKYVPDGIHPAKKSGKSIIAPFVIKRLETHTKF